MQEMRCTISGLIYVVLSVAIAGGRLFVPQEVVHDFRHEDGARGPIRGEQRRWPFA